MINDRLQELILGLLSIAAGRPVGSDESFQLREVAAEIGLESGQKELERLIHSLIEGQTTDEIVLVLDPSIDAFMGDFLIDAQRLCPSLDIENEGEYVVWRMDQKGLLLFYTRELKGAHTGYAIRPLSEDLSIWLYKEYNRLASR